jgi:ubiquinone biosynthesis protein
MVRRYFELCGGGFVKLGQILAMRFDLLPPAYCKELSKLLDSLPPISAKQIIKITERELGLPLVSVFSQFDLKQIASASVSQVHQALLLDGKKVVVKIRRPRISSQFRIDFLNAKIIAWLLDHTGTFGEIDLVGLVDELKRLAYEELDFLREARNAEFLHQLMEQDEVDHYAPKVYLSLCTRSVIVLEKLEGVWMTELIEAVDNDDQPKLELFRAQGITLQRTARLLLRSILTQCFSHRLYHADPHAANLVLIEGGTLAYVDFGMVGWLDERSWAQQLKLREQIANETLHAAYETLLDILQPLPNRSLRGFEHEIKNLTREYILASKRIDSTLVEKSIGTFFFNVCNTIRRERLMLPSQVMRLYRTVSIADMVMLKLYPDINWIPEMKEFVNEETTRQLCRVVKQQHFQATLNAFLMSFINAPQAAGDLVEWVQHKLPDLGRDYLRELSLLEKGTILFFKYLKTISLLVGVTILGSRWFLAPKYGSGMWADLNHSLGGWWWLVAGGTLTLAALIQRLLSRLRLS